MSKKKEKKVKEKEIDIKEDEVDETKSENDVENNSAETEKPSISDLENKIQGLQDTLLRKVAEFENYKRRTENDQLNLLKYAAESFILKVLPVYDDLGRSVGHLDESNQDSLKEGLKLVFDKFTKVLDDQGVKKLDVKGEEFDVEFHEALMQQPSNDFPPNTVLDEVEAGYMYKDKVIRHAKVIVCQEIEQTDEEKNVSTNENEE